MTTMMIDLLGGTKVIKNARFKKQKLKKNFYSLLGTHQGVGLVHVRRRKKRDRKFLGVNVDLFESCDQV